VALQRDPLWAFARRGRGKPPRGGNLDFNGRVHETRKTPLNPDRPRWRTSDVYLASGRLSLPEGKHGYVGVRPLAPIKDRQKTSAGCLDRIIIERLDLLVLAFSSNATKSKLVVRVETLD
jgi:hypothetical protein